MDLFELLIAIAVWLGLSLAAAAYASNKGRSGTEVFFMSLLLSPLVGFAVAVSMQPDEKRIAKSQGMKKCPVCAEFVQADAKLCRYCHYEFPSRPSFKCPNCGGKATDITLETPKAKHWWSTPLPEVMRVCHDCGWKELAKSAHAKS